MKYLFRCPECGTEMEQTSPIERGPVPMWCPDCSDTLLPGVADIVPVLMRRVWNAVPAIFRGGGWASKS